MSWEKEQQKELMKEYKRCQEDALYFFRKYVVINGKKVKDDTLWNKYLDNLKKLGI